MATKHRRHYTFSAENGLEVTCLRGEEPPTVTGGHGGWSVVDRPRRRGYSYWGGVDPIRMRVPCLFDGWRRLDGIETDLGILANMGMPPDKKAGDPPVLDVIGAVPYKGIDRWVIESLEWGTNVIWGFDKHGAAVRYRQDVVVNLLQFIDPTPVAHKPAPSGGRPPPKHKFHVVKRGETLRGISAKEYGNQKWWRDIKTANHIHDPKKLRIGQKLRMP